MANTVKAWAWICQECQRECVPVRAESRCMCGHRLKQHTEGHECSIASCSCPKFSFIVAEGSWILRCRCKHKHTEHDPSSHACRKTGCSCSAFSSPWVCNCNHAWSQHEQVLVERQVLRLSDMMRQAHHAGSSSSTGETLPSGVTPAAAASPASAAAAAGVGDALTRLQELDIGSRTPADVHSAAAAAAGASAARAACESDDVAAAVSANSSSNQGGRLSCGTSRLQQLQHLRQKRQQVPDTMPDTAARPLRTAAAAAGAGDTSAMTAQGLEMLLAEGDLTCDVNRWDLVQRGMGGEQLLAPNHRLAS